MRAKKIARYVSYMIACSIGGIIVGLLVAFPIWWLATMINPYATGAIPPPSEFFGCAALLGMGGLVFGYYFAGHSIETDKEKRARSSANCLLCGVRIFGEHNYCSNCNIWVCNNCLRARHERGEKGCPQCGNPIYPRTLKWWLSPDEQSREEFAKRRGLKAK